MSRHRVLRTVMLQLLVLLSSITVGERVATAQTAAPPANQATEPATEPATGDTPPAAATGAEPAEPQPIAAADIAPQAEEISARLREITKLAAPVQDTTDIEEKLPDTTQEIARLTQDLADHPPASLRGGAARQHWAGLDTLLGGWQKTLQKRSTALQAAHCEIESSRGVWKITQSDDLPQPVKEQITAVLSGLDASDAAVAERSEAVLTLQGQVSKQRDSTSKAIGQLDEIAVSQRSKLFVPEQEPLWNAFSGDDRDLGAQIAKSRSTIAAAVTEFATRYKANFVVHAAMFLFLLVIIWLTRRAESAESMSAREIERVSVVLKRPFSTALLVSMLMMKLIYPVAPAEIIQLQRLISLIPVLRLVPRLVPKYPWMFVVLAIVFVADTAAELAVDGSLLQRLMLLAVAALAIVALGIGLIREHRCEPAERMGFWPLARTLGWLAILGLVGSLAANILGAMALATLLAGAMLNAIWALVLLRVAINVVSALLNLILRAPLARQLRSVQNDSELIYRRVVGVLRIGGIVLWIGLVLNWLQLWAPIAAWGKAAFQHEWVVGTLAISVSSVAAFILVIAIATILSKLTRFFLQEDVLSRLNMPRGAPATISTVVHYTIVGIGVVIAFAASGVDLSKLGFIVGALGVGIGFGLQSIVNNFVSGLILIAERPIKVGDLIELTGTKGHVTRIGARASTIRTFAGAEIIIPNGDLISSQVTNWTLSDQNRRAELLIPVAREADPRRVVEILENVAREEAIVLDDPAPYAAFQRFEEQGMVFALRAWPTLGKGPEDVVTALVTSALVALREAGIDVPYPQREVLLRRADGPAERKATGSEKDPT